MISLPGHMFLTYSTVGRVGTSEKTSDTYLLKQMGKRKARRADNNILTQEKMRPDRLHVLASKRGRKNYFLKQRKNYIYIGMESV